MAPVTGGSAPPPGAVGSYYASAAAWAWNVTWLWSADKLAWGVPVAVGSAVISALVVRWFKGNWIVSLIAGMGGTVGGPLLVLLGVFVFNLGQYPVIHEAQLQSRPHTFGPSNTLRIFDQLRAANLRVPGGWSIIFTRPSGESGQIQGNLTTILQEALGEREVHFLELPDYRNLKAPRFPEPSDQPGITIHGGSALAHALINAFGGCFSMYITEDTVAGLPQYYGVQDVLWIDIGKGSPWRGDLACSG
jgi:hypothetical protein